MTPLELCEIKIATIGPALALASQSANASHARTGDISRHRRLAAEMAKWTRLYAECLHAANTSNGHEARAIA